MIRIRGQICCQPMANGEAHLYRHLPVITRQLECGTPPASRQGDTVFVTSAVFSLDGEGIVAASEGDTTAWAWDGASGQLMATLQAHWQHQFILIERRGILAAQSGCNFADHDIYR
jgi:hypothetical protein